MLKLKPLANAFSLTVLQSNGILYLPADTVTSSPSVTLKLRSKLTYTNNTTSDFKKSSLQPPPPPSSTLLLLPMCVCVRVCMCGCVSVCARNTVLLILLFFRFCVYIYVHLGKRSVLTLYGKHSIIEITTVIILKELSFGG